VSDGRRRVPTDAEWQRLDGAFGVFFLVTLAVAAIFIMAAPFTPLVGAIIMSPLVVPTAWIWIMVIRRRDADRLLQLNAFAARRRGRRRPGRPS
jgi:membrane protein implicated in regulation of membrane protease activity